MFAKLKNKIKKMPKKIVTIVMLLAITFTLIGVVCLRWYIEDFQNDVITHYQNGDYHIVKRPNGDITYKIIPTDYD